MKANIGDLVGSYFEGKQHPDGTRDFWEGVVIDRYKNEFGFLQYEVKNNEEVKCFWEREFYVIKKKEVQDE
jgi:hypothetical protein